MKISYAYHLDAAQPGIQSGRPASILRGFEQAGVDVHRIFPLREDFQLRRLTRKIFWHSMGRQFLIDRDPQLLASYARQIEAALEREAGDIIFSPSTLPLSDLQTDLPITFCADASLALMMGYYRSYTRLSSAQAAFAEAAESAVLKRAALAVYPSEWAARSAIEHYGMDEDRVAVIPFGANLGQENTRAEVAEWIDARESEPWRILFVGREWERKGGDLAVETVRLLTKRGARVQLDLVGTDAPASVHTLPFVRCHGLLSANANDQRETLAGLFRDAHVLFVPSRAEAYGMVYAEANAFGLPCLATYTGGITGIVRDGVNGHALPLAAGPEDYADCLTRMLDDPRHYRQLARSAFDEFEQRLNWTAFSQKFLALVHERVLSGACASETREEHDGSILSPK